MNEIIELIQHTVSNKPKHFSQILKRNEQVVSYINSLNLQGTFVEQIYQILNPTVHIVCPNGNTKKFKSIKDGYGFCGRANVCKCASQSVSQSVSATKQQYSTKTRTEINNKRKATLTERYGVDNAGQTQSAKANHQATYNDKKIVSEIVNRVANTKLERHGSSTYNNPRQIVKTCRKRYGVDNAFKLTKDNSNPNLKYLEDKAELELLYNTKSIDEIAIHLDVHVQTVYKWLNYHELRQPFVSTGEQDVVNYLTSIGITNIVRNTRKVLPSKRELDIYLPEYGIAIEYNGVYWHNESVAHITKTYHYDKFKECESQGIQLLTIFCHDWQNNKEVLQRGIYHKLNQQTTSVYARQCDMREVSHSESVNILNCNHVQQYTPAKFKYGLYYNDELVAMMTFSPPRVGIGKSRGDDAYELVRYVSSVNVIGGASKLLTAFIRKHTPSIIFSYSNNTWSNGGMYRTLGFELEKEHGPGYYYFDPATKQPYHRYKYAKHKLVKLGFDEARSESDITREIGLLKIWDCGKRTWILKLNT